MGQLLKSDATSSARQLIQRILSMMKEGFSGFSADKVQGLFRDAASEPTFLKAARERLSDPDPEFRWLTAVLFMWTLREMPEEVDASTLALAENVIVKQLTQTESLSTLRLCEYLRGVAITPIIVQTLRRIVESDSIDFAIVVSAAAAVAPWEKTIGEGQVRNILYHYIEHKRADIRVVSAIGLLRLPECIPAAVAEVQSTFHSLEPAGQTAMFKAIMDGISQPAAFRDLVRQTLGDPKSAPVVRYFAAKAIPSVFTDADEAVGVLVKFLHRTSAEFQAMASAVDTLRIMQRLPEAFAALLKHRNNSDSRVRCAAARGLSLGAPVESEIAGEVASWLSAENDVETCEYLGGCLSRSGRAGVAALVAAIEGETNLTKFDLMARSMGYAGEEGITALTSLLDPSRPERMLRIAVSALMTAGPRAMSATTQLCELIETTDDYELCLSGLICLMSLGPKAPDVIPTLLRLLMQDAGDEDVLAHWATMGLLIRRSEAIPAVQAALEDATDGVSKRLRTALSVLSGGIDPRLAYLEIADADALLRTFVQIATVLEAGDVKSIKVAVSHLNKSLGRRPAKGKRWVENTTRREIDRLGDKLGRGILTETVPQRGTWLTPAGRKVLLDAREYLSVKLGRVGD